MSILGASNSSHLLLLSREIYHHHQQQCSWNNGGRNCSVNSLYGLGGIVVVEPHRRKEGGGKRDTRVEGGFWPADVSRPVSIEMEQIADSDQLDQILANAQQASQPILIDWMAAWCRKCIYLKPKLEKLAAEYDTKIKFYCVDVNKVPLALVKRGNISKMPTIQLWKDGEMKAEVIGGHKAWLVMDEVREMIQKFL